MLKTFGVAATGFILVAIGVLCWMVRAPQHKQPTLVEKTVLAIIFLSGIGSMFYITADFFYEAENGVTLKERLQEAYRQRRGKEGRERRDSQDGADTPAEAEADGAATLADPITVDTGTPVIDEVSTEVGNPAAEMNGDDPPEAEPPCPIVVCPGDAALDAPGTPATTYWARLNARSGPGTQFAKLGRLPRGGLFDILQSREVRSFIRREDAGGTSLWAWIASEAVSAPPVENDIASRTSPRPRVLPILPLASTDNAGEIVTFTSNYISVPIEHLTYRTLGYSVAGRPVAVVAGDIAIRDDMAPHRQARCRTTYERDGVPQTVESFLQLRQEAGRTGYVSFAQPLEGDAEALRTDIRTGCVYRTAQDAVTGQ